MTDMTDNHDLIKDFEKYISYARKCLSLDKKDGKYIDSETQRLWDIYVDISDKRESEHDEKSCQEKS